MQSVLAWIVALCIRFIYRTSRWKIEVHSDAEQLVTQNQSGIGVFWHSRLLMVAPFWEGKRSVKMLISGHRDGLIIAKTIKYFGFGTVRGSSNRDSRVATNVLRKVLESKEAIAITPDGPRGPRMRLQQGCSRLSMATGAPIIPLAFSVKRGLFLKTWDRFLLPFPFNSGIILCGEPISPQDFGNEHEEFRLFVENKLIALTQEADRRCGRELIEPALEKNKISKS
ncbi:lysophospholipid acyltransferase family protein [Alphaproteobacteria bacterium]|nr:lysophospholipid acyltransferase family protein [Alphaproteobacteria bacterium]